MGDRSVRCRTFESLIQRGRLFAVTIGSDIFGRRLITLFDDNALASALLESGRALPSEAQGQNGGQPQNDQHERSDACDHE